MAGIGPATSPLPRECSTTEPHGHLLNLVKPKHFTTKLQNYQYGAGEGNRTLVISLENFCSTIELHPHRDHSTIQVASLAGKALTWLQTLQNHFLVEGEGFEPSYSERTDLQSVAFNHSATPPNRTQDYADFLTSCQTQSWLLLRTKLMVPDVGIELTTFALQVRCSTN